MDVKKWGSNLNRLLFNLADKIDLRKKDKYIALSSISIYYACDKSRNILIKKEKKNQDMSNKKYISTRFR